MEHNNGTPTERGWLDPDALPWPETISKADLGVHVLPLTFEGELMLTEHDGEYVLHVEHGPGKFTFRLSVLDLWGLRSMLGDVVMDRVNEVTR
jgi:hypothetical protein